MKTALFPGSFDPVTFGHLDVIKRAASLFDNLIVGVAENPEKNAMFDMRTRKEILRGVCSPIPNVKVASFRGLLIKAAVRFNATTVIRGLRAISDFEYEFQMAMMNREMNLKFETIFLMPSPQYSFISSRMIKEIAKMGGDVSAFVPESVVNAIKKQY
jgi:pantetheine-phosphate adenylyltransferase